MPAHIQPCPTPASLSPICSDFARDSWEPWRRRVASERLPCIRHRLTPEGLGVVLPRALQFIGLAVEQGKNYDVIASGESLPFSLLGFDVGASPPPGCEEGAIDVDLHPMMDTATRAARASRGRTARTGGACRARRCRRAGRRFRW